MTLVPTLRYVALRQATNCEYVFTLMSVGKRRHETLELGKFQLLRRQRQRLQRRTNQNRLFSSDTRHCKIIIILALARTFVAMDEEKLIKAVCDAEENA